MDSTSLQKQPPSDQPLFKKRGAKKSAIRKRPATPPPDPSDSDASGYTSTEDEGRRIKRRKKSAVVAASSNNASQPVPTADLSTTTFAGDRSAQITETNDATKQSNWYDEKALLGSTRPKGSTATPTIGSQTPDNGTYKGASAYQSFITKNPNAAQKQVGPVKAPTNIRTITVTDFAPDVCKDYKQTGFCGFGDSCKFLHAREDYKQGWELDRDWEIGSKNKKNKGGGGKNAQGGNAGEEGEEEGDDDALLESIPFACVICKKPYSNPIVTKCGHYFCERCALGKYRRNPSCAACGAGTGGVFNGAKGLKRLLERKRERARKRRERAREEGEEVSGEEGEDGEDGE